MPAAYYGMNLSLIHRAIGLGRDDYLFPCAHKYRKVELVLTFEEWGVLREYSPEICFFLAMTHSLPLDFSSECVS
jgi:hypothetical protein